MRAAAVVNHCDYPTTVSQSGNMHSSANSSAGEERHGLSRKSRNTSFVVDPVVVPPFVHSHLRTTMRMMMRMMKKHYEFVPFDVKVFIVLEFLW